MENMRYDEAIRLIEDANVVEIQRCEQVKLTYGHFGMLDSLSYFVLIEDKTLPTAFLFVEPAVSSLPRKLYTLPKST